jgi:hypothetical protein
LQVFLLSGCPNDQAPGPLSVELGAVIPATGSKGELKRVVFVSHPPEVILRTAMVKVEPVRLATGEPSINGCSDFENGNPGWISI